MYGHSQVDPHHERFTVEYIEREATIILNFFSDKRNRSKSHFTLDERDRRILRHWEGKWASKSQRKL